ncbi:MAG: hypothetical protein UR82_C0045G0013 [Candidatus Moranbacteria bacterium GW2011_GWF1_35_5]|nr:MAG: hypothetical protein UR82_C0045G0013 [Candidatus Moranbacteria bacterium GW2011_GWF1_35_5]
MSNTSIFGLKIIIINAAKIRTGKTPLSRPKYLAIKSAAPITAARVTDGDAPVISTNTATTPSDKNSVADLDAKKYDKIRLIEIPIIVML